MTSRMIVLLLILAALLPGIPGCHQTTRPSPVVTITGGTMGTTYSVKFPALPEGLTVADVQAGIDSQLDSVNRQMSTWRSDSDISRFNASRGTDWFPVSAEVVTVLREAQRISELSGGAFDVTVMPLVNLWSFGPEGRPKKIPSDEDIRRKRESVGFSRIAIRTKPPGLRKTLGNVSVDLSAIAKGYGVDQVAAYLDTLHMSSYMVEIGGEVRCKGTKSGGKPWRIGIQSPQKRRQSAYRTVPLNNRSMATSGDYRNYFEVGGQRYSHTIDPRTGRPVRHKLVSVSVVADRCMTADGLATALMVLGPEAGYNLAKQHKIAALFVVANGKTFVERATPEFQRIFK